ncbi:hypothetical protein LJR029_005237 [Caballeronia sp. LjRoot29]|uniref:DUF7024 domain-containing protein n=1 Tax=Caballeronia sp. LjRoot29 TaxID=3342315 RepID=UPI003ECD259A
MKTEVPILRAMGYEVFIPKIIPTEAWFRSGSVDYSYDTSLTIPGEVLRELNSADLHTSEWSDKNVANMNEYFGTLFTMPFPISLRESLRKFEGAVLLRAFGLEGTNTYTDLLSHYDGKEIFESIYAIRERFWFASGYEQLAEIESKLIADRDVFLPVAMPMNFSRHKDTWTGNSKQIMFVCPNIMSDPYYKRVYEDFKRDFGDFPHVIVGGQKEVVNDSHVRGFVSDGEFVELLQQCAVMYYHSREPRHVHYTPVEGAEVGTPVILFKDTLVARMVGYDIAGAVESVAEAREKIAAILGGDQMLIDQIREEQRVIGTLFSEEYCLGAWRESFVQSGIQTFLGKLNHRKVETIGDAQIAHKRVPRELVLLPDANIDRLSTFEDGLDFTSSEFPAFVEYIDGLCPAESWGSWSNGGVIEIAVSTPMKGPFDLLITGGAYGQNLDVTVGVRVGSVEKHMKLSSPPWEPSTVALPFFLFEPVYKIQIYVPHPTPLDGSRTEVGVGLRRVAVRARVPGGNSWTSASASG